MPEPRYDTSDSNESLDIPEDTIPIEPPVEIWDFCYRMDLGYNHDTWRYQGIAPDHPTIHADIVRPSIPVSFDVNTLILKTWSGRLYKIMSFGDTREKVIADILADIERCGFKVV